ncbi:MAG: ATP-binding protein [Myxococcota bacterium]|nr:ATP-binding protein [Myxococcota bacterium]
MTASPPTPTDLVSTIAHDLRSPLSVISGIASQLRETASPELRVGLDKIAEETQRAGRMLENRMILTLLQTGQPLAREWVPVEEMVGAALARLETRLANREVTLRLGEEVPVNVDAMVGTLLVLNLIDNAVRHTSPSSAIEITAERRNAATIIEVADRGGGLPASALRALSGASSARAQGRGLAVCSGIAAGYGGAMESLARPGGGAIVRVTLPDEGVRGPEVKP